MTVRPIRDERVRLRDGRALAYTEWGDLHGPPLLFFHGGPHSRLWCPDEEATQRAGVHLVAPDRPGFGRSDLQPGRRLSDWPLDVAELADALELDRFAVAGFSGGGPYALACAALIGERVTRAGLVSTSTSLVLRERPGAIEELDEEDRRDFELVERHDRETAALRVAAEWEEWTAHRRGPGAVLRGLPGDGSESLVPRGSSPHWSLPRGSRRGVAAGGTCGHCLGGV